MSQNWLLWGLTGGGGPLAIEATVQYTPAKGHTSKDIAVGVRRYSNSSVSFFDVREFYIFLVLARLLLFLICVLLFLIEVALLCTDSR